MNQKFEKISKINGKLKLPGDKSIAHRALIFSAMANGTSMILNLPDSDDIKATKNCLSDLGIKITEDTSGVFVEGSGFYGFIKPARQLNAMNSGTTARLLTGVLAAQKFDSVVTGDASLSNRPMKRLITPLKEMGANIKARDDEYLPIEIYPVRELKNIEYILPIASAQVKSAILLAGLFQKDKTTVIEKYISRDHTERMLKLEIEKKDDMRIISSSKFNYPVPGEFFIPGDISTAAFFIILTLLLEDSELIIENVSLNPTRIGFINHLKKMGADIEVEIANESNGEPFGQLIIRSSELKNVEIEKEQVSGLLDEIPILTIAGIFASGDFTIHGASELKVKETDRIKTLLFNLNDFGLNIEKYEDGYRISGSFNYPGEEASFNSFGDHRIAMALAVFASVLPNGGTVENFECVSVSNPDFLNQLRSITV